MYITKSQSRLLILYTGGTISSKGDDVKSAAKRTLLSQFKYKYPGLVDHLAIDEEIILNILSENMRPGYLEKIISEIKIASESYDGIILCHGSDVLHYTSALVDYRNSNTIIPIVITGSILSIDDKGTDAYSNLYDAILVAQSGIAGVFVTFGGGVYKGTNLRKISVCFQAYKNINSESSSLGSATDFITHYRGKSFALRCHIPDNGIPFHSLGRDIASVTATPFMNNECLDVIFKVVGKKFIVLELYGDGTGNAGDSNHYSLVPVIKRITAKGGMVFISSRQEGVVSMDTYDTSVRLLESGAIPLFSLCTETALARLSVLSPRVKNKKTLIRKLLCDQRDRRVVQLAEHPTVNRKGAGSNPASPARK